MRKISVAFLFCLTSTIANAQVDAQFRQLQKNVFCGPFEVIVKALSDKEINEQPIWIGKDESERSEYAIFVNPKSGAFTIVQYGREMGCVLGIGYQSQTYKLPDPTVKQN